MIQSVLRIEHVYHTSVDRLDYNYSCIEVSRLVGVPDDPIYECAEEVSFSELNDLCRVLCGLGRLSVELFHMSRRFSVIKVLFANLRL